MNKAPQTELVELVHTRLLPTAPGLMLGPLGSGPGVVLQLTGGARVDTYLDRSELRYLTLLILCKDKSQQAAYDTVCHLSNALLMFSPLPRAGRCQWVKSEVESDPQEVGIVNGMHVYSCVARIYYCVKRS